MMRVFLTGGTGYIGSAVLDALLRAGHRVTALVRDPEKVERAHVARRARPSSANWACRRRYAGGCSRHRRGRSHGVREALRAASRRIESGDRARCCPRSSERTAGRRRSSTRRASGCWAARRARRTRMRRSTPVDARRLAAGARTAVLDAGQNGVRTIVVRPGIVYGGSRGIVSDLLKDALNGMMRVIGPGKNRWPTVYDRDLADLYVRLLQAPDAHGMFHANDETDERVNDIVEAIAEHLTQRPDIRHMPLPEARRKLGTYADALAHRSTRPQPARESARAGRPRCRASPRTSRGCSRNIGAARGRFAGRRSSGLQVRALRVCGARPFGLAPGTYSEAAAWRPACRRRSRRTRSARRARTCEPAAIDQLDILI